MNTQWFRKAVIYHILIDRFAHCRYQGWERPEFLGGNLKGVTENIHYFLELGMNTIWISPFFRCRSYHGYDITDYFSVDPRFGTAEDLRELIGRCHAAGIRVIADFVPNHCSVHHPYFTEAVRNPGSGYRDWFCFTRDNDYLTFLSVRDLPKINLEHEPARRHITDAAGHWLRMGLDGFRLDHAVGPSHSFWRRFSREIRQDFPGAVLIGEVWLAGVKKREQRTLGVNRRQYGSMDELFAEYAGELDGVLDFSFQRKIRDFALGRISEAGLRRELARHYRNFPDDFLLPSFLDNHDLDRFLFTCRDDREKLKKAASVQFSENQPRIIYYGTERGMTQKHSVHSGKDHADINARQFMNWEHPDLQLLDFYRNLTGTG